MILSTRMCRSLLAMLALLMMIVPSAGCISMMVQAANMLGFNSIPAQYDGLKGNRVAIVCETPQGEYDPNATTERLADELEQYLRRNVRRVRFVSHDEIADWFEANAGDVPDYRQLANTVDADAVLVVSLNSFSYRDNATLYQGQCDYGLTVYDAEGEVVFEGENPEFAHPKSGGYQLTEMPEEKFHREFVKLVAADIGHNFHANDFPKQFAKEPYIR